jgi:hypothetical protein
MPTSKELRTETTPIARLSTSFSRWSVESHSPIVADFFAEKIS